MTGKAIFVCADPVNAHWQLGPLLPAQGHVLLIGWHVLGTSVDGGIPEEVGVTLARALTSIARVSFLVTETDHGVLTAPGDEVCHLGAGGFMQQAEAVLKREPLNIAMLSSCSPKTAARMFEDPGYPWCLQSQVVLLSTTDAGAPGINRQTLLSLMGDGWVGHVEQLRSCGITGVLRPGVDGDVAGFLSLTEEFSRTLLEALERQARRAKFDWFWLLENDFMERLPT